jgi:GPH family glycoside/pentoside/hexuronide:cation symporter
MIGNLSDGMQSRWGRRRPFMFVGGLLMSLAFALIWLVPRNLSSSNTFIYFLVFSMLAYFGYAVFAIPRNALGIELSTDYHERTQIFAMNTFFAYSAAFLMSWLYNFSFKVGHWLDGDVLLGSRVVMVGVGVFMLFCTVIPAILIHEKPTQPGSQAKLSVITAFRMTLDNRAFVLFIFLTLLIGFAMGLTAPMMIYIGIDYICGGDKQFGSGIGGWSGIVQGVTGLGMAPGVVWLARSLGKKKVLLLGEGIALLGFVAAWWLFDPKHPYLQLGFTLITTVGLSCVYVLGGTVLADICDLDELKYGLRREGMFGAVYQFITKVTGSCVTIIAGYLLIAAGYHTTTDSVQSPETLLRMRLLFIICSAAFLLGAIILTVYFPITEKSARQVRAQIEKRKSSCLTSN